MVVVVVDNLAVDPLPEEAFLVAIPVETPLVAFLEAFPVETSLVALLAFLEETILVAFPLGSLPVLVEDKLHQPP